MIRLLATTLMLAAAGAALGQTFDFNRPSDDRWHYPFNALPGTRVNATCFSTAGSNFANFNDRDGMMVIGWDTTGQIQPGLDPNDYNIASITVTIRAYAPATWNVDLTPDDWFTFDLDRDGTINGDGIPRGEPGDVDGESDDTDPGRPIDLFGVGFGPQLSEPNWTEATGYIGANDQINRARDPYPFVYQDGTGVMLHVEDELKGFHNEAAGVFSFTPTPWAIGVPQNYDPNNQTTPFDVVFTVDLDLSNGLVRQYFQDQLSTGRVLVYISSLTETVIFGDVTAVPNFYTKEGADFDALGAAPHLQIELATAQPGDLTGDGCVNLGDLGVLFGCWQTSCGDLTGDNNTDLSDLGVLFANWQAGC